MIRAAFFDVDNTLLNIKSMFAFQRYYLDEWLPRCRTLASGALTYSEFERNFELLAANHERSALNRIFYEGYAGHSQQGLADAARAWFAKLLAHRGDGLWIKPALNLAATLQADGFHLVAVSGSSHEILAPVLEHLHFDDCLATVLETDGDRLTGKIVPPQMIGGGKAVAMQSWADKRGAQLKRCVGCGDHISDLQMLERVGRAWVVAGDPELEREAVIRDWPILRPTVVPDIREVHI